MARVKRKLHFCTKLINGIAFTSHDYDRKKGQYLIDAEGYSGKRWVGYDTWEKRNNGDKTDRRSSFHPENKRWFQTSFKKIETNVPKLTELYQMPLLLTAPKQDETLLNLSTWEDFQLLFYPLYNAKNVKGVKDLYRKLVKIYHPDMGGKGNEAFSNLVSAYESALVSAKAPVFNKDEFIKNLKKSKKKNKRG